MRVLNNLARGAMEDGVRQSQATREHGRRGERRDRRDGVRGDRRAEGSRRDTDTIYLVRPPLS